MDPGWELDHVLVAVSRDAPELDHLHRVGFAEGPANVHEGQGTACRRVFFENLYLEFIWLEDQRAASAPRIRQTGLAARAGCQAGASRIGLAFRSRGTGPCEFPLETWPYRPPYLPPDMAIPVARNSTALSEPLLFFMPWERRWRAPRLPRPNGAREVTGLRVTLVASGTPSREVQWLQEWGGAQVTVGHSELLEVEFDGGTAGGSLELGAVMPLTLTW